MITETNKTNKASRFVERTKEEILFDAEREDRRQKAVCFGFESVLGNGIATIKMAIEKIRSGEAKKHSVKELKKRSEKKIFFLEMMLLHYLTNYEGVTEAQYEACYFLIDYFRNYPHVSVKESVVADQKADFLHKMFEAPELRMRRRAKKMSCTEFWGERG